MKDLPPTCENKMDLEFIQKKIERQKRSLSMKVDHSGSKDSGVRGSSYSTDRSKKYPHIKT